MFGDLRRALHGQPALLNLVAPGGKVGLLLAAARLSLGQLANPARHLRTAPPVAHPHHHLAKVVRVDLQ